jgi:hypothetical protein
LTRDHGYAYVSGNTWISFARVVVVMHGDQDERPEGAANARLIEAAPELLDALERIEQQLNYGQTAAAHDIACAALARVNPLFKTQS